MDGSLMAVTPNYSWPVPVSTDYVKDGADAIKDLGDAIDATVYGLPSGGLTLINTTTFSAQTGVSIDNCFSATYSNYKVVVAYTNTTQGTQTNIRFRTLGEDNTTSSYLYMCQRIGENGTAYNLVGVTNLAAVNNGNATTNTISFDAISPNKSAQTNLSGTAVGVMSTGSFNAAGVIGVLFDGTTVFDGITVLFAAGTGTGTIKIYGYQD
jgi:hypothetical protein